MTSTTDGPKQIQRYKIGYRTDEWGMRSGTPSAIPDPTGPLVKFDDAAQLVSGNQGAMAELEQEARLMRARMERLQAELDGIVAAIGAGEVQALSAAPAVPNGDELRKIARAARTSASDDASPTEYVLAGWKAAMLTASPTPPAQQATKETSGGFHVWRDISTAPKDGSHFVATGYNYGLYSEGRHICVAQWFRGCWMETSDWNEASELKYLTHWMPLPSPPDDVAAPAEQQAEESCVKLLAECRDAFPIPEPSSPLEVQWSAAMARPEEVPEYVRLCVAAMQAAPKAAPAEPSAFPMTGDEEESDLGQWQPGTAKPNMDGTYLREFDEGEATSEFHQGVWLRDGFFPSDLQDVRWRGRTAPQQEAQEPAFWMNEKGHTWSHSDWKQFPKHRAKYPIPLYPHFPTPQPAPDCHHRPPCDECAAIAAQGGKA